MGEGIFISQLEQCLFSVKLSLESGATSGGSNSRLSILREMVTAINLPCVEHVQRFKAISFEHVIHILRSTRLQIMYLQSFLRSEAEQMVGPSTKEERFLPWSLKDVRPRPREPQANFG